MKKYFDLHVFYSRNNGFSFGLIIESEDENLQEDFIIQQAILQGKVDSDDADMIDSVDEVSEEEYYNIYTKD